MAKAWSVGAWAADAEEAEEAEKAVPIGKNAEAFPSLGEALAAAPKKKKDKKQTMSLSELMTGKYVGPGGRSRTSATGGEVGFDVIMNLPKGPRERDPEEDAANGLGGAFKDYGGFRGGGDRDRRDDDRRGGRRGFDDDEGDAGMPSRADTEDDWGKARKFVPSTGGPVSRGGDRDDYRERGPSAADEEGTWSKKFVPSGDRPREAGFGGRGGGFSDRYEDDRRGGGFSDGPSKADEVDNWGREKKFVPSTGGRTGGFGGGGGFSDSGDRWGRREEAPPVSSASRPSERPRLALQKRSVPVEAPMAGAAENGEAKPAPPKPKSNPFGAARPREEILQEKGQDWKKIDDELERKKSAGPTPPGSTSEGSSRGSSPPPVAKPKPKPNPFGAARPREEVLQEKGVDFRKVDLELEHKRVQRDETPEELALKKEIEELRLKLQGGSEAPPAEAAEGGEEKENGVHGEKDESVQVEIAKKEKELDDLIRKLDDKVRFSKATDKPVKERDWRDVKAQAPPPAAKAGAKKDPDAGKAASPPSAAAPPSPAADVSKNAGDVSKRPAAIDIRKEGGKRDSGAASPSVAKESPKVVKKTEPVKKAVSPEPTIVKGGYGALQEEGEDAEEEEGTEEQGESQEEAPKAPEAGDANKAEGAKKPEAQESGRGWEQVVKGAGKR